MADSGRVRSQNKAVGLCGGGELDSVGVCLTHGLPDRRLSSGERKALLQESQRTGVRGSEAA